MAETKKNRVLKSLCRNRCACMNRLDDHINYIKQNKIPNKFFRNAPGDVLLLLPTPVAKKREKIHKFSV